MEKNWASDFFGQDIGSNPRQDELELRALAAFLAVHGPCRIALDGALIRVTCDGCTLDAAGAGLGDEMVVSAKF